MDTWPAQGSTFEALRKHPPGKVLNPFVVGGPASFFAGAGFLQRKRRTRRSSRTAEKSAGRWTQPPCTRGLGA
ncbi:hypothetical protein ACN469_32350 [Corallococcus terminator]